VCDKRDRRNPRRSVDEFRLAVSCAQSPSHAERNTAETDKSPPVTPSGRTSAAFKLVPNRLPHLECVVGLEDLQTPKGFTVLQSPLGAAALMASPVQHSAGEVLAHEFWNDPGVGADTALVESGGDS
jgi:hypothetical protein